MTEFTEEEQTQIDKWLRQRADLCRVRDKLTKCWTLIDEELDDPRFENDLLLHLNMTRAYVKRAKDRVGRAREVIDAQLQHLTGQTLQEILDV